MVGGIPANKFCMKCTKRLENKSVRVMNANNEEKIFVYDELICMVAVLENEIPNYSSGHCTIPIAEMDSIKCVNINLTNTCADYVDDPSIPAPTMPLSSIVD